MEQRSLAQQQVVIARDSVKSTSRSFTFLPPHLSIELLSRVVYGGSRGVLLHPQSILEGHALHDLCQVG